MPTGFTQQQQPLQNAGFSKTVVTPQHGQAADKSVLVAKEPRSFLPRPAH